MLILSSNKTPATHFAPYTGPLEKPKKLRFLKHFAKDDALVSKPCSFASLTPCRLKICDRSTLLTKVMLSSQRGAHFQERTISGCLLGSLGSLRCSSWRSWHPASPAQPYCIIFCIIFGSVLGITTANHAHLLVYLAIRVLSWDNFVIFL